MWSSQLCTNHLTLIIPSSDSLSDLRHNYTDYLLDSKIAYLAKVGKKLPQYIPLDQKVNT